MRATSILTKASIAAVALLAVAGTGCGDLQAIAEEILKHTDAGTGPTCVYEGVSHTPDETFASSDGCNTCQCVSGTISCTKIGCGSSPPAGPSCVEGKTNYYSECVALETFQKLAQDECSRQNRTVGALNPTEDCGNKTFHYARFQCCDPTGTAQTCTKLDGGGDATSCKPRSVWKTYGAEACTAQGMALTDISYQNGCDKTGENFGNAIFVCCGANSQPTPPTPAPSPCTKVSGGGGAGSCKPISEWKSYGGEACTALGMSLTNVAGETVCDKTTGQSFQNAIYICCAGAADSSGIRCATGANADGTTCESCWDGYGALVKTSCAADQ